MSYLPLVGLPADTYESHGFLYHSIGDKYVRAVAEAALCTPVMIPSMIDALEIDALLDHFDGILIDGCGLQRASTALRRASIHRARAL